MPRNAIYYQVISLVHDSHHGFLTGSSCTTQLLLVHHDWFKVLHKSGQVDVVFIDFSKAFDLVCHDILLAKLYKYGVHGDLLNRCRHYLTERQQRVVVKGEASDWLTVNLVYHRVLCWDHYSSQYTFMIYQG